LIANQIDTATHDALFDQVTNRPAYHQQYWLDV